MWLDDNYVQPLATAHSQIEDTHSAAGAKEVTLAAQAALQHIFEDCQQVVAVGAPPSAWWHERVNLASIARWTDATTWRRFVVPLQYSQEHCVCTLVWSAM
jgi:hypothetical protein